MCIDDSLSYQQLCSCRPDSCSKSATQCVSVSLPVEVSPVASVGEITTSCQGTPVVTCQTDGTRNVCVLTVTQQVCMTIPVNYGVRTSAGTAEIGCAEGPGSESGACGCMSR